MEVVKIGAEWCSQCNELKPIFKEVASELGSESVVFREYDADVDDDMVDMFEVTEMPLVAVVKDGEIVKRHVGVMTKDELIDFING